MSTYDQTDPPSSTPEGLRLSVAAIVARAALATIGHDPARFRKPPEAACVAPDNAVKVTAESVEAALRTLAELNAAGYAARRGPDDPRQLVVTGWDADRLELRADCLAADVAATEAARFDEARGLLAIYEHQLAAGCDAQFARRVVDMHLRVSADDQIPEYNDDSAASGTATSTDDAGDWEDRRAADKRAGRVIEARRLGQWDRRVYQPGLSATEAEALAHGVGIWTDAHPAGEQVAALAGLEAAAETLAARRYQVADEVSARYDALSGAGAPRPREQALDEVREGIWGDANEAVLAGGLGGALWQARLDLLDDMRTEQQRAKEIDDLCAQQRGDTPATSADASTGTANVSAASSSSLASSAGVAAGESVGGVAGGSAEAIERARRAVEGLHHHNAVQNAAEAADAASRTTADDSFADDDPFGDDEPRYDGEDWT